MCQYSSSNGSPVNWHYKHLKSLGNSGAGMLMIEATAIEKEEKLLIQICFRKQYSI